MNIAVARYQAFLMPGDLAFVPGKDCIKSETGFGRAAGSLCGVSQY